MQEKETEKKVDTRFELGEIPEQMRIVILDKDSKTPMDLLEAVVLLLNKVEKIEKAVI